MLTNENGRGPGQPLSGNLFQELRREILQGTLHPGEKLSENRLSETYGLSRTPVREALRQLEAEGLVATVPNRGAFVVGLTAQDIQDLYDMRKAYEILAVRWAIRRIDGPALERLKEAFEFMEFYTLRGDGGKMLSVNREFHESIYRAAGNRMLAHTLEAQQFYLQLTRAGSGYLRDDLATVLEEHRRIYDAIAARDEEAGENAIAAHLENARRRALKSACQSPDGTI